MNDWMFEHTFLDTLIPTNTAACNARAQDANKYNDHHDCDKDQVSHREKRGKGMNCRRKLKPDTDIGVTEYWSQYKYHEVPDGH